MQSLSDEGSLTQMIAEPTRVTQNSTTLIDHIYASSPGSFLESGCLNTGVIVTISLGVYGQSGWAINLTVTKRRQLEPLENVTMNRSWRTFKVCLGRQIDLISMSGGTSGRKYSLVYLTNMPQSSAVVSGESHCLGLTRTSGS